MVAVVDLRPGVAAVRRSLVPTHRADLASEVDGRVGRAAGGHPEADAVSQDYVCQLREAGTAIGRVPYATCAGVGADQLDIVGLVIDGHDLR